MGRLYLSNFNSPKIIDLFETNAIAIVNKKLVNRTVSFENELVPLNGRIGPPDPLGTHAAYPFPPLPFITSHFTVVLWKAED